MTIRSEAGVANDIRIILAAIVALDDGDVDVVEGSGVGWRRDWREAR